MCEGDEGVRNGVSTGGITWEDGKGLPSFEVCSCPILFQYYVPSPPYICTGGELS